MRSGLQLLFINLVIIIEPYEKTERKAPLAARNIQFVENHNTDWLGVLLHSS